MKPSGHHEQPECANEPVIEYTAPSEPILGPQIETNQNPIDYEQKSYEIACADLKAQWLSADTAHRTFWITVLGLALIAFTLYETLSAGILLNEQNRIALNATKAEFQPYLRPVDYFGVNQVESGFENKINTSTLSSYDFEITNIGKTPAYLMQTSIRARFYKNGRHFDEAGVIESSQIGDFIAEETRDYQIRIEFDFPNGDGRSFSHPKEIDFYITATFLDNFTEGQRRTYVFHYLCDAITTGAKLQSIEEQRN